MKKLKTLLIEKIAEKMEFIGSLEKETNPQIKELVIKAKAEQETLEAVFLALQGDDTLLKLL